LHDLDMKKPSMNILQQIGFGKEPFISIRLSFADKNMNGTMFAPITVSRWLDEKICLGIISLQSLPHSDSNGTSPS